MGTVLHFPNFSILINTGLNIDGSHVFLIDINRIKTREPSPCLHRGVYQWQLRLKI